MKILLMEDELAISTALSRMMRRWGHEVFVASCLEEARKSFVDNGPEALVSDLKLPDGKGTELARELGLPFILMSGFAQFDDAVDALRMGCVDFLTKPVGLADLRKSLDLLVDRLGSWDLCLVAPTGSGLRLNRPGAAGIAQEDIEVYHWQWDHALAARQLWDTDGTLRACSFGDQRQLLAELLQAAPSGELVINTSGYWWRACLTATVDWQHPDQADRRRLLEHLASRCLLRTNGALIEVLHEVTPTSGVPVVAAAAEET